MKANNKLGICCFGEVGRNFTEILNVFGYNNYVIIDDNNIEYNQIKSIGFHELSSKDDIDLYIVCLENPIAQKTIIDKLKKVGIPDDSIRIYNYAYYMEIWMKDVIVKEIYKIFNNDSLAQILKHDSRDLSKFSSALVKILDEAPKWERDSAFYDSVYANSSEYDVSYEKSCYFPIWKKIVDYFYDAYNDIADVSILDIGCGNGQFAEMMFDYGVLNYKGIDFSNTAITKAKTRFIHKGGNFNFDTCDISSINFKQEKYSCATILEVLEHIEKDIELLSALPKGLTLVASVPSFHSEGHIRVFKTQNDIYERYGNCVDIKEIYEFGLERNSFIYLMIGTIL